MSAYTLFIANKNYSSWSLRPWLLMTELGIRFTEKLIPFEESNHVNFKAFAPSAKVPCLHDGGTVVWDSLAIMEYLADFIRQEKPATIDPWVTKDVYDQVASAARRASPPESCSPSEPATLPRWNSSRSWSARRSRSTRCSAACGVRCSSSRTPEGPLRPRRS